MITPSQYAEKKAKGKVDLVKLGNVYAMYVDPDPVEPALINVRMSDMEAEKARLEAELADLEAMIADCKALDE